MKAFLSQLRPGPRAIAGAALLAALGAAPREAGAYSYSGGVIGSPCHERMTWWALRTVRAELGAGLPAPLTDQDRALVDDLPFRLPDDLQDRGAAALVIGVRDNDLKGEGGREADSLTFIHGDPDLQREHCLRRPEHDEPGGSEAALADCRAFIRERMLEALDGLGPSGDVDYGREMSLEVTLGIRGKIDVNLPLFFVKLGQALHAVQDGFSHTLRSPDGLRVRGVLNFIDEVEGRREASRDGPPHFSGMDDCEAADDMRRLRVARAAEASTELARAALDPARSRAEKEAAIDAVLATYFSYEPGCGYDNGWCDAPELTTEQYRGCACRSAGGEGGGGAAWAGLLGLAALGAARRRRKGLGRAAAGAAAVALALAAAPGRARAQDAVEPAMGGNNDVQPIERDFGVYGTLGFGGSIDNAALAGRGGALVRLSTGWLLGVEGEWNPFLNSNTGSLGEGAANVYGTVIRQYQLKYEAVNLRTTLNAGVSILAMDLVGAPAGQVGPYVGISPLGVEWKVARGFYVVFDPTHIAVPVPNTKGAIFAYPQYRAMLGIQFGG
ncbi:MAG TPA: MYXO-CTERM sorting domain-containing protein [Polyangiaceae bacterium]|nr:MYXO-CTERM sorting domain-containing protein [Polyangiaceae bacterium]